MYYTSSSFESLVNTEGSKTLEAFGLGAEDGLRVLLIQKEVKPRKRTRTKASSLRVLLIQKEVKREPLSIAAM